MLRHISLLAAFMVVALQPLMAEEICSYTAKISSNDKKNRSGKKLLSSPSREGILNSIRMDRANFHRFLKRDAEDTSDCLFAELAARDSMDKMLSQTVLSAQLINRMWREEVVLSIKVFPDRLEISEAWGTDAVSSQKHRVPGTVGASNINVQVSSVPDKSDGQAVPPVHAHKEFSLIEHAETAKAYRSLQNDRALMQAFQQFFDVTRYAGCEAMLVDLEQGLNTGRYELTPQQITTYSGVAAGMVYVRQHLTSNGTEMSALKYAVSNAVQRASVAPSVYEQCYQAMLPVYEATRQRR
jgi:hypothetical protein